MQFDVKKLIQFNSFVFGSGDNATRTIPGSHRPGYWERFIRFQVEPTIKLGIRRFLIHCPGGAVTGKPFEFDQLALAEEAKLTWLLDDFVSSWKALLTREKDLEVICYLGTITGSTNFDATRPAEWMARAQRALHLPLEAGMSIGLDAVIENPIDSPMYRLVQYVTSFGTKVYVEGFPEKKFPQWAEFNVISLIDNLHRAKTDGWGVPYDAVKGEIVQLANMPPQGHTYDQHDWEIEYYAGLLCEGFSLCAMFDRIGAAHKTLGDLAAAVG